MIGLEKIIRHIEEDGQKECGALLSDARRQAAQMRQEYDGASRRLREEGEQALSVELSRLEKSRRDQMQTARRRALLQTKQTLVEEAFRDARQALSTLNDARKETLYAAIVERAQLPEGVGELILSEADRAAVGAALADRRQDLRLSEETRPIEGFVLRYGPVEVDCTLETLLEELRRRMSSEIAALLFDGEGDDGEA